MDCNMFREMLDNYENLTEEEKLNMAEHTAVCEECREEFDFFMSIMNSVKTLPEMEVPDDFLENVNKRIDAEVKGDKIIRMIRKNWKQYSTVAACLIVAVVIGVNSDMLVSKMTPEDNGIVISEKKSSSVPEKTQMPVQKPDEKAKETAKETAAPAEQTAQPEKQESNQDSLHARIAAGMNGLKSLPIEQSQTPVVASQPSTVNTAPSVKSNPTKAPEKNTAVPSTQVPAVINENMEAEIPENYQMPQEQITVAESRQMPEAEASAVPETEATDQPYTIARAGYSIPQTYGNADTDEYDAASDYSISNEEAEISLSAAYDISEESYSTQIQSRGSLYIPIGDANEFMVLLNSYISGSEGEYYLITPGSLAALLGELEEAGINYGEFIDSSATGQIAFNVVFF